MIFLRRVVVNSYTIEEHRHNFSAWAAARAAQRGFTDVNNLKRALEGCGVREFLQNTQAGDTSFKQYHDLHSNWCNSVMEYLESLGLESVTFGRAAKLIAIYVKSMVVIRDETSSLAINALPPIDGVLLKNISKDRTLEKDFRKKCANIKWTQLDENEYNQLIEDLKKYIILDQPMWSLEHYWTVTQNT